MPERQPAAAGRRHRQIERAHHDQRQPRSREAQQRERRQVVPADPDVAGAPVGPREAGLRDAQPQHREVRHREREHRPERVDRAEELGLARDERDAGEAGEHQDAQVGRAEARVQPSHGVGHLAVQPHRVHEPRDAEHAGVGGRHEDRDRQDADVELRAGLERAQLHRLHDPEHRVGGEATVLLGHAEQRRAVLPGGVAAHRQRRQRDPGQREVDREDGDHHALDRRRDRRRLVARLPRHVRDRLDPGVGDRADRDRDQEVLPGRRDAEVGEVVEQQLGAEDEEHARPARARAG